MTPPVFSRGFVGLAMFASLLVPASTAAAWQAEPPGPFAKVSPANGATGVELSYVTLQWQASAGASWGYEYCIDTVDDGACTQPPGSNRWTFVGSALTALVRVESARTYFWQVRALNPAGTTYADGASTSFWRFTTVQIDYSFFKVAPADGATMQPTELTLSWTHSVDRSGYRFCYDTVDDNGCTFGWQKAGGASSWLISGLHANTTYFWQVRIGFSDIYADGPAAFWRFATAPFRWQLTWQHSNGQVAAWFVNGLTVEDARPIGGHVSFPDFLLVAQGDFNGDGETDLVFRYDLSGELGVWFMRGTTLIGTAAMSPARTIDGYWRVRTAADMDGDGQPDLVWQNIATGQVGIWFMNGIVLREARLTTPAEVDPDWRLVAAADMDQDGHQDLIWQHGPSGQLGVWLMNGAQMLDTRLLYSHYDPNFILHAVTDVNGDGWQDLIWQNHVDGRVVAWPMTGLAAAWFATQTGELSARAAPYWSIGGTRVPE